MYRHVAIGVACILLALACSDPVTPDQEPHFKVAATFFAENPARVVDETGTVTATISCGQNCRLYHPRWSRNGKSLALIGYDLARNSILYVVDEDGNNLREITRVASIPQGFIQGLTRYEPNYYDQEWSGDGRLAYVKRDTIFQVAPGATTATQVAIRQWARALAWMPGDTTIAFLSGTSSSLNVVSIKSGAIRSLGPSSTGVESYDPAPDGQSLAVTTRSSDQVRLYVVNLATTNTTLIATYNSISNPCWSEDSKALTYVGQTFGRTNALYVLHRGDTQPMEVQMKDVAGGTAFWVSGSRWLFTLANPGFALVDLTTNASTTIASPGEPNGFAVSSARCGKMFYLLPDGF